MKMETKLALKMSEVLGYIEGLVNTIDAIDPEDETPLSRARTGLSKYREEMDALLGEWKAGLSDRLESKMGGGVTFVSDGCIEPNRVIRDQDIRFFPDGDYIEPYQKKQFYPMEDAPKDGSVLLLRRPSGHVVKGRWGEVQYFPCHGWIDVGSEFADLLANQDAFTGWKYLDEGGDQ